MRRHQRQHDERVVHFFNAQSNNSRIDVHIFEVQTKLKKLQKAFKDYITQSPELWADLAASQIVQFEKNRRRDQRDYQANKRAMRNKTIQEQRAEDAEERSRLNQLSARYLGGMDEDARDCLEDEEILFSLYNQDPNLSEKEESEREM